MVCLLSEIFSDNIYSDEILSKFVERARKKAEKYCRKNNLEILQTELGVVGAPGYGSFYRITTTLTISDEDQLEQMLDQLSAYGGKAFPNVIALKDGNGFRIWEPGDELSPEMKSVYDDSKGFVHAVPYIFERNGMDIIYTFFDNRTAGKNIYSSPLMQ